MSEHGDEHCVIRDATGADFDALVTLFEAFTAETVRYERGVVPNPDFDARSVVRRYLDRSRRTTLLAESGSEAVGFACVEFRPGTDRPSGLLGRVREVFTRKRRSRQMLYAAHGYLGYLYVSPAFRRRDIGRQLVLACGEWTGTRGGKALDLNVLATNEAARALYRKLGMTELILTFRMEL